ncbi:period circadian protein homolog 2-like [Sinocyclocheilus rhinocerous]|uniref:period circadian protein homolog 2-like n=1 Tax=Sinocyclocheilus rhinocerous TaxID=307959 RepID=UPI0007B86691|nr:PREDICTED: period circadian protein homolog 2-like [Sinocyclocheilus rhinocerous]
MSGETEPKPYLYRGESESPCGSMSHLHHMGVASEGSDSSHDPPTSPRPQTQMHEDMEMGGSGSSGSGTESHGNESHSTESHGNESVGSSSGNGKDSAIMASSGSNKSSNSQSLSPPSSNNAFSLVSSEQDNPSTSGCSSEQSAKAKSQKELFKTLKELKYHLPHDKRSKGRASTLHTLRYALRCVKQVKANEEYYQMLMINDSQPSGLDVSSYTIEEINSITLEYTLKNADIFAVAVSLITGKIVYISEQAAGILNCRKDEFKDRKFVEFLTPRDVSVFYSFTTPYRLPSWSMCTGTESSSTEFMQEKSFFCRISGGKEKEGDLQYYPFRMAPYLMKVQDSELSEEHFCCLILAERVHSGYEAPRIPPDKRIFTTTHTPNCVFQDIDERAVPLLGFLPQDLIGTPLLLHLHPSDRPVMLDVHRKILQYVGQPFDHSSIRFCVRNGEYVTLDTSWCSFVNPWSRKVSFVIGRHKVRMGPMNEDVFSAPAFTEEKIMDSDIQEITEQVHRLLLQPVHSMGSSGYGSHGSNGSHEHLLSIASSSDSNGNANTANSGSRINGNTRKEESESKPRSFQEICKGVHMMKAQEQQGSSSKAEQKNSDGGKEKEGDLQYYPFRMAPYLMKVQDSELSEEHFCCLILAERVHSGYEVLQYVGQPFDHSSIRFCVRNGEYVTLDTSWCSFVNPWSRKVSFVIGRHKVRMGPMNEDVFSAPAFTEEKIMDSDIQEITEQVHRLLLQPVHSMGSSGYGSHGSNGSHEHLLSIASSSDSNGNANTANSGSRINGNTRKEESESKPIQAWYCLNMYAFVNCVFHRYLESCNVPNTVKRKYQFSSNTTSSNSDEDKKASDASLQQTDDSLGMEAPSSISIKTNEKPPPGPAPGRVVGGPLSPLDLASKADSVVSQGSYSSTIVHVGDKKTQPESEIIEDAAESPAPSTPVSVISPPTVEQEAYKKLGLTKQVLAAHTQKEEQAFLSRCRELRNGQALQKDCPPSTQRNRGQAAEGACGSKAGAGVPVTEATTKKTWRTKKSKKTRTKHPDSSDNAASQHRPLPPLQGLNQTSWSPSETSQSGLSVPFSTVVPGYPLYPVVPSVAPPQAPTGIAESQNTQATPSTAAYPTPLVTPVVAFVLPGFMLPQIGTAPRSPFYADAPQAYSALFQTQQSYNGQQPFQPQQAYNTLAASTSLHRPTSISATTSLQHHAAPSKPSRLQNSPVLSDPYLLHFPAASIYTPDRFSVWNDI